MKTSHTLLVLGACALFTACTDLQGGDKLAAPPPATSSLPALPTRTTVVGLPGEAEQLRTSYSKLTQLLAKDPNDMKSWLKLSEVFITEARITGNYGPNYDAALDILDRVLASTAGTNKQDMDLQGEALTLKAVIKLSQHKFDEALVLGEKAVVLDPHRAFNYGVLVDANVELGNYARAVEMSDKMVGTRPDLRSYSRVSYLREIHGDVPGAMQAMDMAVKAGYPGSEETSWCRVQLGGLHERNGAIDVAKQHYQQALAERPDYPFALAALGRVEGKLKNYTEAEAHLNKAIAMMPDAHFYETLARVYKAHGKTEAYAEHVEKAEEALIGLSGEPAHDHAVGTAHDHGKSGHGHSHETGLEMARYELEFHNDLPNALANAEHEFEHRENNIDVNAAMAAILYAKGDAATATVHIDLAKRTGSTSAELLLIEGLIAAKKGQAAQGKKLIAQAFAKDPYLQHPLAEEGKSIL